ncbi:MAG: Ku protein [Bacillaceae bacterium]|nr:Ku protein [Bacillaceae bacterium]
MHTMWKGSISFGLVNIPVRMFTATEDKDIRFRQLHKECHTPIKYTRTCPTCEEEVALDEIVKGYEYEPGRFVIVEKEELETIAPESKRTIEIVDFVDLKEIDPVFFDRSYFLSPSETGEKAYRLLQQAMEDTGKIGVAKITIRNKESLAVIRVYKGCIIMETIYYPDEVREVNQVPGLPENVDVAENEMKMAVQLIENLAAEFDPEKYKDEYRDNLKELIQKKLEGEEIKQAPEVHKARVVDLMEALQASVEATQKEKKAAKGGRRRKKATS